MLVNINSNLMEDFKAKGINQVKEFLNKKDLY